MVNRIYVEKKTGYDIEAQGLFADLKENLNLEGLRGVRVLNRYDIEGINHDIYEQAKYTVFAEPAIDHAYDERVMIEEGSRFFAVEYLPGQYDQRADSAAQCIKLMNADAQAIVQFARLIVLQGDVSLEAFEAIKKYCINPVDSHEASMSKPDHLSMETVTPAEVKIIDGFIQMADEDLAKFKEEQGFAMSDADLKYVREYFSVDEKRNPTATELKVIDTYWSDHCRHTTFLTKIRSVTFGEGEYAKLIEGAFDEYLDMRNELYGDREKDQCLMDMAVIGAKYIKKRGLADDLDESEEINACSIKVKANIDGKEEDWLVMFKNETHNHPTEIEPFGGAATCLGGAIRDPLSGRVYVYQAMRVTGSGDPRASLSETRPGKLPQRIITRGAARGYSSYGNQIGLATGQVTEIYDEGYVAKRMEIGAVIGAAPADHVRRERPEKGDFIVLIGGRTGRDGCGGATGSSKGHTMESILTCGAEVQKGNPPVERNVQRLFRRKEAACLIKRCNDFGAGGVSVAIGELADGIDVNLDLVPKKYDGLDGTELAISESQERMAAVVSEKDLKQFIQYAEEENLEAVAVARVTDLNRFRMSWRGSCVLNLSREFLNSNGAKQVIDVMVPGGDSPNLEESTSIELETLLGDLNCCSQKGLIEMFDSTIGAATVLMPLGGKYQLSPAAGMAAKIPVLQGDTTTTTLMCHGFDPSLSAKSPYHGALYAVVDSMTKIGAMGGDVSKVRLTFQEYFERLGTDPEKWARPFMALLGALKAQKELGVPAIGGKDSMSGTFMDIHVPPTLVSFAVGTMDAEHVISTELKRENSTIVLLSPEKDQKQIIDFQEYKRNMKRVRELALEQKILAANTIGKGGIFISLVKMAVGNQIGVSLKPLEDRQLKLADYGAILLEVAGDEDLSQMFESVNYQVIGTTNDSKKIVIPAKEGREKEYSLEKITKDWTKPLEGIFPTKRKDQDEAIETPQKIHYKERFVAVPKYSTAKPRVFVPVFPGTNCEVDTKRAFEKAGAEVNLQILRNLKIENLKESIETMVNHIKNSQMIMIPGGFSGGDEPDGSAKFITAVFRNPAIKEAVEEMLEERDGLMLGICNGFQALIKLGLVPYGNITEADGNNPTLTYNRIGRHASCLVRTRIASVKSPWFANVEVGDIHTIAVSHGEGRFIAEEDVIRTLIQNGQVATQYVDLDGNPTLKAEFNPNESLFAIEGITSPDGRVLGKMGHSERIGKNLYKNVIGNTDQKLFEAGVAYFR